MKAWVKVKFDLLRGRRNTCKHNLTVLAVSAEETFLKDVLVLPLGVGPGDAGGEHVVPSVEEDAQGQEGRVLVRSRVAEHWSRWEARSCWCGNS